MHFGYDVLADGGLAGRFGPIDFDHTPTRDAAHAEGNVKRERAGGEGLGLHVLRFAETDDGTIAVAFEDVSERFIEHGAFGAIHIAGGLFLFFNSGFRFSRGHGVFLQYSVRVLMLCSREYSTDVLCVKVRR